MQPQTKPAGERRGLSHELRADRERAARRHHDGDPVTVVQPGHHRLGRREDRVGALDDVVRRQAPGALAEVHRTTGKVESNANGSSCRRDGVEDRVVAVRHDVVVVGDRRRPAQRQLGQADRCRYANVLDGNTRPDRVELLEPREQVAAGGTTASQPLVQVVVGIDKASCDDASVTGDHLITRPRGDSADLGDHSAFDSYVTRPARPSQNLPCGHAM